MSNRQWWETSSKEIASFTWSRRKFHGKTFRINLIEGFNYAPDFELEKRVVVHSQHSQGSNFNILRSGRHEQNLYVTPFEMELCGNVFDTRLPVSLNKKQRWDQLWRLIDKYPPAAMRVYSSRSSSNHDHTYTYLTLVLKYVLSDDVPSVSCATSKLMRIHHQSINPYDYVWDEFARRRLLRHQRRLEAWYEQRQKPDTRNVLPKNMCDARLHVRLEGIHVLAPPANALQCYPEAAHCASMQYRNCWKPYNTSDYLLVMLPGLCRVSGFGTKGRFPRVDREGYIDANDQPEWIPRYKVLYRCHKHQDWILLGVHRGNDDASTEVAHRVRLDSGETYVVARQLRFQVVHHQPCSDSWAARVAVYGTMLCETDAGVDIDAQDIAVFTINWALTPAEASRTTKDVSRSTVREDKRRHRRELKRWCQREVNGFVKLSETLP